MDINTNYSLYGMKDYAAEFKQKCNDAAVERNKMLQQAGVTIPIGQPVKKDDDKGIKLEHADEAVEQKETLQKFDEGQYGNLALKENREALEAKVKQAYLDYGTVDGQKITDEKQAQKMAEQYVKDKTYEFESNRTTVFMDKEAYKTAEKERDAKKKELVEQYRSEGLRRRQARRKAEAMLGKNEYIKSKDTRAFVENHEDMFYDEKGDFSSDKFKASAVDFANTHTGKDEAENHYLSLKERREVAAQYGVDDDVISDIANKSNVGFEKDHTPLIRAGVIVGAGAAGYVAGTLFLGASAAASSSAIGGSVVPETTAALAGSGAAAGATAGATAEISGAIPGGLIGLVVGGTSSPLLKDKGNKEPDIYEPGVKIVKPDIPEIEVPPVEIQVQNNTCVLNPDEVTMEHEDVVEYCDYKVQRGEYWSGIVRAKYRHEDGSPLSNSEVLQVVHELKLAHGIARKDFGKIIQPNTMRLYTQFDGAMHKELKGKKFVVDCDSEVKEKTEDFEDDKKKLGKWGGKYNDVKTLNKDTYYYWTDCNNRQSDYYNSSMERDVMMATEQVRINAGLQ